MKLSVDTTYRSKEKELMDDLQMDGELLYDTLDKIAEINKLLGGNKVVLSGLDFLLKNSNNKTPITIVDLGCGNGAMLRTLAVYARKKKLKFTLIGIDANAHTLAYAETLSQDFEEIQYKNIDVFSKEFDALSFDIVVATLFMHHFDEQEILSLVQQSSTKATIGVVINDLHRHWMSYYLFKVFSLFFGNKMTRHDGAISILRGFKKDELATLAKQINNTSFIRWKWAFRYQWIIQN